MQWQGRDSARIMIYAAERRPVLPLLRVSVWNEAFQWARASWIENVSNGLQRACKKVDIREN